jgi:putative endopeptidase
VRLALTRRCDMTPRMQFHMKATLRAGVALALTPFTMVFGTVLVAAPALAEPAAQAAIADNPPPVYGTAGLALSARDTSVKPGDDFDKYANGTWQAVTVIPADKAIVNGFDLVADITQKQLRTLITAAPAGSKYGALYQSFMDESRIEQLGAAPLLHDIAQVRALPDKAAFARFMGRTTGTFGDSLVSADISADPNFPTRTVLGVGQSGLGLPERDYYLKDTFKKQRDAYQAYIERTFALIGDADPAGSARAVMAFETAAATVSWAAADRRDIDKTINPMSAAELAAFAPGLDWTAWFEGLGVRAPDRLIVGEKSAVRDLAKLYADTPLATLKAWEEFHVTDQASRFLPKAFVDSRFEFVKSLVGVSTITPRWKRGVGLVDDQLGELVGKDYVAQNFPAEAKARMVVLVGNLKAAMADRIKTNPWMSQPTREAALAKLARMDVMVGYPDKWRDWDGLRIDAGDLYGNVVRASAFNRAYEVSKLGKPLDRTEWGMNPQTVNAYNGFFENKIVFPAAILQQPFFGLAADDAVNYGAIGAVIGHEISHGFDDQGRKVDASGMQRDWWSKADVARFEAGTKVFGDQYAKFEVVPGTFVNPTLTMGENIADFAGVLVALDAYHKSLGGKPAPVIDGLTGDQRFFLGWAQVWRAKSRDEAMKSQATSNEHTPDRFRILGPLRNVDAWYAAFNVKPGDAMYIPPEQRARIW